MPDWQEEKNFRFDLKVQWASENNIPELLDNQIHIWFAQLDLYPDELNKYEGLLSFEEGVKASKFYKIIDAQRYIAAHGILRSLIGNYLRCDPSRLGFEVGTFGKPFLKNEINFLSLSFNMSHSDGIGLFGFSIGRQLGVDLERNRPDIEIDGIIENAFSKKEAAFVHSLPEVERINTFYKIWTQKEAYLKARGEGFSFPPRDVEIALPPDEAPKINWARDDSKVISRWAVWDLSILTSYTSAVVIEAL